VNHSFSVEVATLFGVDEAILIENFRFWIAKNRANGRHFYDGHFWTYNSSKAMAELFPYWSAKQIERILSKLKVAGVLKVGHYSQNAYDRTNWYTVLEDALPQTRETISKKPTSPFPESGESTRTDVNTDVNTDKGETPRKRSASIPCPNDVDQQTWADWLALRKEKRASVTATVIAGARRQADKAGMTLEAFLQVWCRRGSQGLEADWLKPHERTNGAGPKHAAAAAAIFDGLMDGAQPFFGDTFDA
jgi:hypothetical protein